MGWFAALLASLALATCAERPAPAADPTGSPSPAPACVDGFSVPASGSANWVFPLHQITLATGEQGPFHVVAMRYFTGPESPPSDKGYLMTVERWYVKLVAPGNPAFKGRFLVERRQFGSTVAAVAPFITHGWVSPDWSAFQWNSAAPQPKRYPGLPGAWPGIKYDFVKGGAGLTIPGLPSAVTKCLDGT